MNQDKITTAADLESIAQAVNIDETSEGFQALYRTLLDTIGPELSVTYYEEAMAFFRQGDYGAAAESFDRAVYYDASNEDALFNLARSYHKNGDAEEAIETYQKLLELFPDSARKRDAKRYLAELGVTVE